MVGDFFTKPLTGAKFRKFRNIIMNCDHDEPTPTDYSVIPDQVNPKMESPSRLGSQECVGNMRGLSRMESKVSRMESKVSRMESNDVTGDVTMSSPRNISSPLDRHRTYMAKALHPVAVAE